MQVSQEAPAAQATSQYSKYGGSMDNDIPFEVVTQQRNVNVDKKKRKFDDSDENSDYDDRDDDED